MSSRDHWDAVYSRKAPTEVSWYQPEARVSLELIRCAAPSWTRRSSTSVAAHSGSTQAFVYCRCRVEPGASESDSRARPTGA